MYMLWFHSKLLYIRYMFYMRNKLGLFNKESNDTSLIQDLLKVKSYNLYSIYF